MIYLGDLAQMMFEMVNPAVTVEQPIETDPALAPQAFEFQIVQNASFSLGFFFGSFVAGIILAAASLAIAGLRALLNLDHKTRILLDCWDRENAAP